MPTRRSSVYALVVSIGTVVGCSSKTTPAVESVPPDPELPFVEITPEANEALRLIAESQKLRGWFVRLEVVWKPDAQIEVNIEQKAPGPNDFVVDADGLGCVMSNDQKVYLKGARVDLFWVKTGAGFDVTFPYRTRQDQELASRWLNEQKAKKKA